MTKPERRAELHIIRTTLSGSWTQMRLAIWGFGGNGVSLCALQLFPISLKAHRQWGQLSGLPKSDLPNNSPPVPMSPSLHCPPAKPSKSCLLGGWPMSTPIPHPSPTSAHWPVPELSPWHWGSFWGPQRLLSECFSDSLCGCICPLQSDCPFEGDGACALSPCSVPASPGT